MAYRDLVKRNGIEIVQVLPSNPPLRMNMVTSTDVLAAGDLLEVSSGSCRIFGGSSTSTNPSTSTDNNVFCGICAYDVPGNDNGVVRVEVITRCVLRVTCATTAITPGGAVTVAAGPNRDAKNLGTGIDWTFVGGTAANAIGWGLEDIAVGSTGLILIDGWISGAMFTSSFFTLATT